MFLCPSLTDFRADPQSSQARLRLKEISTPEQWMQMSYYTQPRALVFDQTNRLRHWFKCLMHSRVNVKNAEDMDYILNKTISSIRNSSWVKSKNIWGHSTSKSRLLYTIAACTRFTEKVHFSLVAVFLRVIHKIQLDFRIC